MRVSAGYSQVGADGCDLAGGALPAPQVDGRTQGAPGPRDTSGRSAAARVLGVLCGRPRRAGRPRGRDAAGPSRARPAAARRAWPRREGACIAQRQSTAAGGAAGRGGCGGRRLAQQPHAQRRAGALLYRRGAAAAARLAHVGTLRCRPSEAISAQVLRAPNRNAHAPRRLSLVADGAQADGRGGGSGVRAHRQLHEGGRRAERARNWACHRQLRGAARLARRRGHQGDG
mmetsp:Transcript_48421/g.116462  ORF Transcript_48421/g.116462 Transcript_48421/m.116462 type:complete len:230 (-) Transcript_48421:1295-1984(-)